MSGAKSLAYQLAPGASDDVPDEQDVHAGRRESVSTGIFCDLTAAIEPLGKDDRQLAAREPGLRLRDLEGPAQTHGARETAEAALQQMKVGFRRRRGRGFLARDDEDVAAEEHPDGFRGNAGDVDDDFDG